MKLHISTIFSSNAWYKIEYIHLHVNEQWNCENKDSRSIVIDKKKSASDRLTKAKWFQRDKWCSL